MRIFSRLAGLVVAGLTSSVLVGGGGGAQADGYTNAPFTHHLQNFASGMCLQPHFSSSLPHELIIQYPCRNASAQEWFFEEHDPQPGWPLFKLRNNSSLLCMAPVTVPAPNGTQLEQVTCDVGSAVLWEWFGIRGSVMVFRNLSTGRCLDIPDGIPSEDVLPQIWDCNSNTNNQIWGGG